jgi:AcrR family transcriptional regulator
MEKATVARPPKQHRSRQTLHRIARAALELIAQYGVEATTVGAIARRAGSSVGSFYARFDGKRDLLVYLDDRIWETIEQRWSEATSEGLADRSIEQLVLGLARLYADLDLMQRGARDAIDWALRGPGDGPSHVALRIRARVRDDSARLLLRKRDEIVHSDPEVAVGTVCRTLEAAACRFEPAFLEDLCTALVSHLVGARPPPPTAGASVEFFDIWS